jgi:signal peptidase I
VVAVKDAVGPESRVGTEGGFGADQKCDCGEGRAGADHKHVRRLSAVTQMVLLVVIALALALVIKTFVVQPFYIPSGSMENTIRPADRVLVNKLVYHLRPIRRGDIVVFSGAGSWDGPPASTQANHDFAVRIYDDSLGPLAGSIEALFGSTPGQTDYIKRVIGLPGDHVVCCNVRGQITVNGVALAESYLMPGARPSQEAFNVVVPPGRLWVMGDNRTISEDSRFHDCAYAMADKCHPWDRNGTIPQSAVIGRAFIVVWPPSRIQTLPIPATFGQPGLNKAANADRAARKLQAGRQVAGGPEIAGGPGG